MRLLFLTIWYFIPIQVMKILSKFPYSDTHDYENSDILLCDSLCHIGH